MTYELTQDFHYTDVNKQILVLKQGTSLTKESDYYIFKIKQTPYKIEADIVENNPSYFEKVDIETLLQQLLKKNRKSTSPKQAKIVKQFIDENVIGDKILVGEDTLMMMLEFCRESFYSTDQEKYLEPFKRLGYKCDESGVYK